MSNTERSRLIKAAEEHYFELVMEWFTATADVPIEEALCLLVEELASDTSRILVSDAWRKHMERVRAKRGEPPSVERFAAPAAGWDVL